jgi:hypothetical protein
MPSMFYLILRSARRARLEGRMMPMQLLEWIWPHTTFPGFMMLSGSIACLMRRISSSSSGGL